MSLIYWLVGGAASVLALFFVLQGVSDKTYRPCANEVREIIRASIEGRLSLGAFDEFSCVRIAYNKQLDHVRESYNTIVNAHVAGEVTAANSTPLSAVGKAKLLELVQELAEVPAQQGIQADAASPRRLT